MNPVNATALYVSASRSVLQCDPGDPRELAELCKVLPFFRQSLSCLVCGNLLQDPIAPTDSSCQHYVCRGCKGQRMQLKPSCSWCKDYARFEENQQLSLLVRCYRKLCLYITQSPLAPHLASAAGDSPDLQAILEEGLALAESEPELEVVSGSPSSSSEVVSGSPSPPPPRTAPDEAAPPTEVKDEERGATVNGLHDCNGLVGSDSLQPVAVETGGGVAKQEGLSEEPPACGGAAAGDVGHCGAELKRGGAALLLSVEEVLRTLDTDPAEPADPAPNGPNRLGPVLDGGPRLPRTPLLPPPSAVAPHVPPRCHRKRSRSESDSEKVQPLSISSFLRGPALPAPQNHAAAAKHEPRLPTAAPHLPPVPNGGPPKVGKTVLVHNKALKKTVEHHGPNKKPYAKPRQAAPKPRAQPRDRAPPPPHPPPHPPSPSKPLYKKPVEKKGCKCGRATQNPSVLTCRGQRCPCYSNRKACLDCICRGCQNSYMANGEKKLEAFAVPEKALEQTRLTLGINLTSIAAAALRSPVAVAVSPALLNVTTATGAPVSAAFLSAAGHDNRTFEESLEMRFDC